MTKITLKNTFTLFHKKKFEKIIPSSFSADKNLNQNSSWFQSIEPIIYAKKNSKKLYEIEDFLLNEVDKKPFKEKLFKKLKKDFDNKKELIREKFLRNSDGSLCVGQNVILIDSLLKVIFKNIYLSVFNDDSYRFSMVAVGGYGRGELAPYSDLDLLFLLPDFLNKSDNKKIENVVQSILYFLWDLGFTIGHSTRSIQDCIQKSSEDLTISTSLLEKRLIIGNQDVFDSLNDNFKSLINSTRTLDFVHAKLEESDFRHNKFGGSRYVVEPNVKDGKGGLRDIHTLGWISKFVYQIDSISKLINMGVLSKREAFAFAEAQRFLLSVRCHLHFRAKREDDRLAMDAQLEIASIMNFKNTLTHKDVERFMKRYFLATKAVGNLTRIFCAEIEAEFNKPLRLNFLSFKKKVNVEPFSISIGRLFTKNKEIFSENPINILRLFHISHNKNIDIHPKTIRQVASLTSLINREVRNDFQANKLFLDILTSEKDPSRTLRAMNESNVLGKFIPEFQKIVCLMQFDMYHSFTVDEHTLFTISNLHSLKNGKFKTFAPLASEVILQISSHRCLFVAMFLHDIAKGKKGDHSENGAIIASEVCPRLGLNQEETKTVEWLVLNHLLMSKIAFRYELGDPKIIEDFSNNVMTVEKLKLLLVLTVADIKGVGPEIWNDWKGSLISELFLKSLDFLKKKKSSLITIQSTLDTKNSLEKYFLKNGHLQKDFINYSKKYYSNYWRIFNLSTIIDHFQICSKMENEGLKFKVHVFSEAKIEATELLVIAPDHHGLFSLISGLVAASGFDVVSAKIITRSDGYALDTFYLQNKDKKPIADDYTRKKLIKNISTGLEGGLNVEKELNIKWKETPARYRAIKAPVRVIFDNKTSNNYTILEVKCKNAPGVLYRITKVITNLGCQINTANVSTYGDRVVDIFYLKNAFGLKIEDNTTIEKVRNSIFNILEESDPANQMIKP
jgi:[protein-PII] uridylyltransferase